MKNILLIVFVLSLCFINAYSQSLNYKLSGYFDTYYVTDNDGSHHALSEDARPFAYINKQKDQFRLNVAQIQGDFKYENRVRGTIAFHTGDLLHSAWEDNGTTDPTLQQANGGFMVFENFWVDAGYFLTHIGGEVLLPKNNWLTTYSLVTNFEPFYQAGVRFSYETSDFTAQLHLINGSGIFEDNNFNKTVGIFLSYNFTDKLTIAYANVIGNEEKGEPTNARLQMFHNLDVYYNISDKFKVKGQVDLLTREEKGLDSAQSYLGIAAEAQYLFADKFAATIRGSYITCKNEPFREIKFYGENGNEIALGVQYKPADMIYCRIEGRMLSFDDKYKPFGTEDKPESSRMEIMLNLGITLE